jgi:hypothetical protein
MRWVWVAAVMAAFAGSAAYGLELSHAGGQEVTGRAGLSDQRWIGRAVYSREGAYLGDVAAINEDDHSEIYVDISGFLALGGTTVRILPGEVLHVRADGLVLRFTEPEARGLPPAETTGEQL